MELNQFPLVIGGKVPYGKYLGAASGLLPADVPFPVERIWMPLPRFPLNLIMERKPHIDIKKANYRKAKFIEVDPIKLLHGIVQPISPQSDLEEEDARMISQLFALKSVLQRK